MKILVVTQSKDIFGGANRSLLDVMKILKHTYSHELFAVVPGEGQFTDALKECGFGYAVAEYYQTSFVSLGDGKDFARYARTMLYSYKNKQQAREKKKLFADKDFDIVYINDTTNSFGYFLAKELRKPFVWHFRGYNHKIKKYFHSDKAFCKDDAGKSIAISNAMRDYMISVRGMKADLIEVVHNGVIDAGVKIKQPWSSNIDSDINCLHCGHISQAKGQMDSVMAIAHLKERGIENVYLHLAGTPASLNGKPYDEILKEIIVQKGIEKQVIFHGEVKDMPLLRKNMHMELMCSVAEPFGRVTVEGMQAGLVVIGSNTGATPEIIKDGETGLLYEQGNSKDLADKIEQLYKDRNSADRLSANSLKYISGHFTMEKNVEQINNVIMSVVKKA